MPSFSIGKQFSELLAPEINLALTSTFKKYLTNIKNSLPKGMDIFVGYWDTIPAKLQQEYRAVRKSGLPTDELYDMRDAQQTFHAFFYNKHMKADTPSVVATGRGIPLNPECRKMYKNGGNYINYSVEPTNPAVLKLSLGSWAQDFAQYENSLVHPVPNNDVFPSSLLTLIQKEHFFEAGGVMVADGFRGKDLGGKMGMTLRTVIRYGLDSNTFAGVNRAFWPGSSRATTSIYTHSVTTYQTPVRYGTNVRIIIGTEKKSLHDFLISSQHFQDLPSFAKRNGYIT